MKVKELISAIYKIQVGQKTEFKGRVIERKMPGLWLVDGEECVGVCDLIVAFGAK